LQPHKGAIEIIQSRDLGSLKTTDFSIVQPFDCCFALIASMASPQGITHMVLQILNILLQQS
jgi:hypothetical protein